MVLSRIVASASRLLQEAVSELAADDNRDEIWEYVRLHDGRRMFANQMLDNEVEPLQVIQWGKWKDWQTFRDHYLKDLSVEYQLEQLSKVDGQ